VTTRPSIANCATHRPPCAVRAQREAVDVSLKTGVNRDPGAQRSRGQHRQDKPGRRRRVHVAAHAAVDLPAPHQVSEMIRDDPGDTCGRLAGLGIGDEDSGVGE
jgi:hypothetical protein